MIIVQLTGGLGNQLFQYSMGKALAVANGFPLKLDLSFFPTYTWHAYSLAPFNIAQNFSRDEEVQEFKVKHARLSNRLLRYLHLGGNVVVYEKGLRYNPHYKQVKDSAYLVGYWQCEKYFENIKSTIIADTQIVRAPSEPNATMLKGIRELDSVSLHVRRGNFVNVPKVNKVHGATPLDYYHKAMAYIEKRMERPVYFVFSDDIQWARENLASKHEMIFVDINDAIHDYEDLRLMSNCKHNIIANSTFSWWGAWLNMNPDKIIIAPEQWFADPFKNSEAVDIVPKSWIRF